VAVKLAHIVELTDDDAAELRSASPCDAIV
jgi:hypothetical protein